MSPPAQSSQSPAPNPQPPPDPLTGLPSHAALTAALKQAMAGHEPVGLALLDVDRFLELNEGLGSEAGDRVLRTLGAILEDAAPGRVYRVAGDEFAILLPGVPLEQTFLAMEQVRLRVNAAQERFGLPQGRAVAITAGVAEYPRDAKDPASLMRTADAALMAAKEGGRNQVALPPNEEMVMKSCYYAARSLRKLRSLAERLQRKESALLREGLDDLLRKYDRPQDPASN